VRTSSGNFLRGSFSSNTAVGGDDVNTVPLSPAVAAIATDVTPVGAAAAAGTRGDLGR